MKQFKFKNIPFSNCKQLNLKESSYKKLLQKILKNQLVSMEKPTSQVAKTFQQILCQIQRKISQNAIRNKSKSLLFNYSQLYPKNQTIEEYRIFSQYIKRSQEKKKKNMKNYYNCKIEQLPSYQLCSKKKKNKIFKL